MTAWRDSPRPQTGFTLLELVVAITLMGVVLVLLYSGLRLGLNGWDGGEARAEATNRLRLVEEFLRRQLAQSMTVYQANDRQERVIVFAGQAAGSRLTIQIFADGRSLIYDGAGRWDAGDEIAAGRFAQLASGAVRTPGLAAAFFGR